MRHSGRYKIKNRKINVLKLTAGSDIAEPEEIEDELEVYQKFVDGCIECVRINERLVMVVNDEGLIRDLPDNCNVPLLVD